MSRENDVDGHEIRRVVSYAQWSLPWGFTRSPFSHTHSNHNGSEFGTPV